MDDKTSGRVVLSSIWLGISRVSSELSLSGDLKAIQMDDKTRRGFNLSSIWPIQQDQLATIDLARVPPAAPERVVSGRRLRALLIAFWNS
jgi:hypothetical protein